MTIAVDRRMDQPTGLHGTLLALGLGYIRRAICSIVAAYVATVGNVLLHDGTY